MSKRCMITGQGLNSRRINPKRDNVLNHENRQRLIEIITEHPGIYYSEIKRALEIKGNGNLTNHLEVLEKEGYITSIKETKYRTFFPTTILTGTPA